MVDSTSGADLPPKRILSLDGGGIRGAVAVAFLERIEQLLTEQAPPGTRVQLADHFHLVGGTSTGSIIAIALALGHSASEIRSFYTELAPRVFRRSPWRIIGLQTVFDSRILKTEIEKFVGTRKLDSADLKTTVAIVTKRIDTGSPWIVCSHPDSKFWNTPSDNTYVGNRNYRLSDLIRASTAAPHYFAPEEIEIIQGQMRGLFVDGGVSPYNNPSLALLMVATLAPFGMRWPHGPDKLKLISIGTGSFRLALDASKIRRMTAAGLAIRALMGMIIDGESQTLAMLHWLGQTETPWTINSELGNLDGANPWKEPLFSFSRYDIHLERSWIKDSLGVDVSQREVERLRRLDEAELIPQVYQLGRIAAERQIKYEHIA